MGIGSTVTSEIRRDPVVADFLVCLASACLGTKFFRPELPEQLRPTAERFFRTLPPINHLTGYADDSALIQAIGLPYYEILRFILMSNRAHLICLPPHLKIAECARNTTQLLSVVGNPECERVFQGKKRQKGTCWLWHGSFLSRWHSILHTGLKDLGRTADKTHMGASTYGPGVYMSNSSTYSYAYSAGCGDQHSYENSQFPKSLIVMALVENICSGLLKNVAQSEWTQRDLDGIMVRVLMIVNSVFEWDVHQSEPGCIPSLDDCLTFIDGSGPRHNDRPVTPKSPKVKERQRTDHRERRKKGRRRK
jgi:hypothetical protein